MKYYNFSLVHSIQRNFLFQMGDPLGTGKGGESVFGLLYGEQAKYFESEKVPKLKHRKLGTLSMANNGENMHGSQFFITTGEDLDYLDGMHTVFGEVVEGFEILTKVNDSICNEEHRPYKDIRITHTVILDDPYKDPAGLDIPAGSPEPTEDILKSDYIGVDEDIDDNQGKSIAEVEEEIQQKEAKARATILEMVGDLPDAEVRPPDNILFICKLNPVTTDEDLEIIFSRFGQIVSCEVVRDRKTGESLQYAFIEFDKEEDCENAYFKMDNVLIDDRRIHVDFSQSVSKLNYLQKGSSQSKGSVPEKEMGLSQKLVMRDKRRSQGKYNMVFDEDDMPAIREKLGHDKNSKGRSDSESENERRKRAKKSKHHSRDKRDEKKSDSKKSVRDDHRSRSPAKGEVMRSSDKNVSRSKDIARDKRPSRSPVPEMRRNNRSRSRSGEPSRSRNAEDQRGIRCRSRSRSPDRRSKDETRKKRDHHRDRHHDNKTRDHSRGQRSYEDSRRSRR